MRVSDLSNASLMASATRTGSQSLLWLLRFTNGYQDVAAGARWNAAQGFSYGYNDYTTGNPLCEPAGPATPGQVHPLPGRPADPGRCQPGDRDDPVQHPSLPAPRPQRADRAGPAAARGGRDRGLPLLRRDCVLAREHACLRTRSCSRSSIRSTTRRRWTSCCRQPRRRRPRRFRARSRAVERSRAREGSSA